VLEYRKNALLLIRAGCVLTPDQEMRPGAVLIRGGRIEAAGPAVSAAGAHVVDLPGLTLVPGFIDLHVHGGGGFSLATDREDEIRSFARWAPSHGVTGFLAGVVARSPEEAAPAIATVQSARPTEGAELLGVNLEGPFVNPARRGALPETWASAPQAGLFQVLLEAGGESLRLMTVAPEVSGALDIIRRGVDAGVRMSVGHTDAGYEEALAGFRAGATHVTHLFNAMRPFHQRDPGAGGAALDSPAVTVEVIADGVHLHPATVRMIFKMFGPGRVALITDGVPPAGLGGGVFRLGGQEARLEGGRVTLPDGTIAGSAATMDEVVANAVRWGGVSLADAARMASTVPAAVAGAGERKGRIAPGYDADIVALSEDLRVEAVWAGGRPLSGAAASSES